MDFTQYIKMFVSTQGKQFIKSYEMGPTGGVALNPYDANDGYMTIGWGHKIIDGENYTEITSTDADLLFEKDLYQRSLKLITTLVRAPLTQHQLDALASYVYNTGSLFGTRLLFYLNNRDYKKALSEMNIITVQHKKSKGLERRRNAEHDIWSFGKYVNN